VLGIAKKRTTMPYKARKMIYEYKVLSDKKYAKIDLKTPNFGVFSILKAT